MPGSLGRGVGGQGNPKGNGSSDTLGIAPWDPHCDAVCRWGGGGYPEPLGGGGQKSALREGGALFVLLGVFFVCLVGWWFFFFPPFISMNFDFWGGLSVSPSSEVSAGRAGMTPDDDMP